MMLSWSAFELAKRAGVSSATIKKYEVQTERLNANTRILSAVKSVLEIAGIEITGDPLVNPGVTLRIKCGDSILSVLSFTSRLIIFASVLMWIFLCFLIIKSAHFYPS